MGGKAKVFTLAEVSEHNTSKDCWLVIEGKGVIRLLRGIFKYFKDPLSEETLTSELTDVLIDSHNLPIPIYITVYDVTKFLEDHPGGDEVLLSSTGKDATDDFEDVGHSSTAKAMMDEFYVGDIDTGTIPVKKKYTAPKQPHYNQDKTPDFIIKLLQFLVPLLILGVAVGIRFYTKSQ